MYALVILLQETTKKELRRQWFLNKKCHRSNAPAIEWKNTRKKIWMINGYLHRENDLPAVEHPNVYKEYWRSGEQYKLPDNGTREFIDITGRFHRYLLPAIEYPNGDKEWWNYGIRHRLDGPAVIYGNKQFWFEDGEFIKCIV